MCLYTLLLENISFCFIIQQVLVLVTLLGCTCQLSFFVPLSYALSHTFTTNKLHCTPLQWFYKSCIQSNHQLALSRLMHCTHCSNAAFPVPVLCKYISTRDFNRLCEIFMHSNCTIPSKCIYVCLQIDRQNFFRVQAKI